MIMCCRSSSCSMVASIPCSHDQPPPLSHPNSSSASQSHSSYSCPQSPAASSPNSIHTICPSRFFFSSSFWDDIPSLCTNTDSHAAIVASSSSLQSILADANGFALPAPPISTPSDVPAAGNAYCAGVAVSDFPRNSPSEAAHHHPHHTLLQAHHAQYSMTTELCRRHFAAGQPPSTAIDMDAAAAAELYATTHFRASMNAAVSGSTSSYMHPLCLQDHPIFAARSAYASFQQPPPSVRPISSSVLDLLEYGAAGDERDLCGFGSPPQPLQATELYAGIPAITQPRPGLPATTSELLPSGCLPDGRDRNMHQNSVQRHDDHAAGVASDSLLRYYYYYYYGDASPALDGSVNRYTSCCSSNSNSNSQMRRRTRHYDYNVLLEDEVTAAEKCSRQRQKEVSSQLEKNGEREEEWHTMIVDMKMQKTDQDGAALAEIEAPYPPVRAAASPLSTGHGHGIAAGIPTSRPRAARNKVSVHPQGVAARRRRHRISNRFKALQAMVPGGAKMDTASMLDEAILYIKYLRAQILLHQLLELQQLSARTPVDSAAIFRQMKAPNSTAGASPVNLSASTLGEAPNPGSSDVNIYGGISAATETALGGGDEFEAATNTTESRYNYCSERSCMMIRKPNGNADDDVVLGPYYFHVTQRTSTANELPLDHPS